MPDEYSDQVPPPNYQGQAKAPSQRQPEDDDSAELGRRERRSEARRRTSWLVAGVLFAIATLQLVWCVNSYPLWTYSHSPGSFGAVGPYANLVLPFLMLLAGFFALLGVWALYQPIPAGIVGLVAYVGLGLLDIVMHLAQEGDTLLGNALKVVLASALLWGVVAAAKAK